MENILLPEIITAGIFNAQSIFKSRSVSPNRKTTRFELELPIYEGGTTYIDDTSHSISPNVVICAKPGQLRHTRLPFICYYVHIIINEGYLFDLLSSLPQYIVLKDHEEILDIFVSLHKYYESGANESQLMLHSLLLKLIYLLNKHALQHRNSRVLQASNHKQLEKAIAYIKENITADLSLKTLANEAKFSPIYFHKLFKASTGKTLHEYVEDQRIKKAINLLVSTDMTLTQIAYECGFSSQAYFSYVFKKKTGQTPREYAQNVHLKYEE